MLSKKSPCCPAQQHGINIRRRGRLFKAIANRELKYNLLINLFKPIYFYFKEEYSFLVARGKVATLSAVARCKVATTKNISVNSKSIAVCPRKKLPGVFIYLIRRFKISLFIYLTIQTAEISILLN